MIRYALVQFRSVQGSQGQISRLGLQSAPLAALASRDLGFGATANGI